MADATGFDAGTGRVDAMDALDQDVLAPASLSLGSYAWPYSDLQPPAPSLTYTNTGTAAVTLALALTGQDGAAEPTGSMTLSSDTVTVPGGGTSSVEVLLDPTIAAAGAYSAVVTATPDDGAAPCRTGVAYLLEPERYDVKVTVKPRVGTQAASHQLGLSELRRAVGLRAAFLRHLTRRPDRDVPAAARYLQPPAPSPSGSLGTARRKASSPTSRRSPCPRTPRSCSTRTTTGRFGYKVDRPVVDDGAILDVGWTGRRRLQRVHVLRRRRPRSTPGPRPASAGPRRWPPTGCSASPRAS